MNKMTPEQKLKREIILRGQLACDEFPKDSDLSEDGIDAAWESLSDGDFEDTIQDATSEIRSSGEDTGLECEWSRHYESKAVAMQCCDGSWVGWTYWYGGGKHGNPDEIDWIEDAYDVSCVVEMQPVNVFTKP